MLNMTRWTPWTELAGLHRDLDSMFGRVFGEPGSRSSVDAFAPAADLRREGDKWMLSMALPGVAPDKVEIDVVGRTLRIRGERVANDNAKSAPVVGEIIDGRFEREFVLPEDIDAEHVEATYRHGMLDLVLPLSEGAKPRRVEVKATSEAKQLHAA